MIKSLTDFARSRRVAFYDDLSHMNPAYVYPETTENLELEFEVRRHLRNLRLLSLYFDHIAIMYGNLLNYKNATQKYILQRVINSQDFRALCEDGTIILAGFGARTSAGFIGRQIEYAERARPELKDKNAIRALESISGNADTVIREQEVKTDSGVGNLFQEYLERKGEMTSSSKLIPYYMELAKKSEIEHGYLGTLEFFPLADEAPDEIKRAVAYSYYDAWQQYAASRYQNAIPVQSARLLESNRSLMTTQSFYGHDLPALILSPEFFLEILRHFVTERSLRRLLTVDMKTLQGLKNGDWSNFVASYHAMLQETHSAFDTVLDFDSSQPLSANDLIDNTVKRMILSERSDELVANTTELAIGLSQATTGFTLLPRRAMGHAARIASRYMLMRFQFPEFRPFLTKMERGLSSVSPA